MLNCGDVCSFNNVVFLFGLYNVFDSNKARRVQTNVETTAALCRSPNKFYFLRRTVLYTFGYSCVNVNFIFMNVPRICSGTRREGRLFNGS